MRAINAEDMDASVNLERLLFLEERYTDLEDLFIELRARVEVTNTVLDMKLEELYDERLRRNRMLSIDTKRYWIATLCMHKPAGVVTR